MLLLENPTATLVAGLGIGVTIGWLLKAKCNVRSSNTLSRANGDLTHPAAPVTGEYKMVLVVRTDLKMTKGKVAAQCAHAAVGCCENALQANREALAYWRSHGQPKVVVKAENETVLKSLLKKADSVGLTCCIIADAGRTQIAPGSKTVLGVGPGPATLVDEITGHLKLY